MSKFDANFESLLTTQNVSFDRKLNIQRRLYCEKSNIIVHNLNTHSVIFKYSRRLVSKDNLHENEQFIFQVHILGQIKERGFYTVNVI